MWRATAGSLFLCLGCCVCLRGAFREFDSSSRESQLTTLLEGVLNGTESDNDYVLRSIHDIILNSASVVPSELLILALELLQVCVRLLTEFSSCTIKANSLDNPVTLSYLAGKFHKCASLPPEVVKEVATSVCESTHEIIREACLMLIAQVNSASVLQRSVGILSEVSAGEDTDTASRLSSLSRWRFAVARAN